MKNINVTALRLNFYEKAGGNYSDNSFFAANAIFCVLNDFLLSTVSYLVLTLSCRRSFSCGYFNDMLEHLFRNWDDMDKLIQIVVVQPHSTQRVPGQRSHNLILVDSYQTFLDANIISYTGEYNFNEYNYIFLHISDNLMKAHLQQILEYCWTHFIIHCNVQVQNEQGEVLVYTYFPYTAVSCGDVVPSILNQFNGSKFVGPELFPKKLHNLYQCPLRAAVWHAPPFMLLTTNGNTTSISGGIEGNLIREIASLLNFSIEVKIPPDNEQRGKVVGNSTTGAMQMLTGGKADFSMGGIRLSVERNQVASFTRTCLQTELMLFALRSAYDLSSWEILIFPFNASTWLLILFTLALAVLKAFFANRLYKRCTSIFQKYCPENAYLNIFSTFIGVPASSMPWAIKSRILFILWLFFTLVIRTVYQALLFHMIRTRVENKFPETFNEIVDLNFTSVMNVGSFDLLQNMSVLERMHKVVQNTSDQDLNFRYIEEMQSKWFLALSLMEFMIVYVDKYKKPGIFKILSHELANFQTVIYMPKHSFMINQFNEEILWLRVSGFIEFWSRSELDTEYYKENPFAKDRIYGWKELHMIFVIYGVGVIIAGLVFTLELIACRYRIIGRLFQSV